MRFRDYWKLTYHVIPYGQLQWGASCFELMTPWFYVALGLWYPEPLSYIYSHQLAFSWKRNKYAGEGEYYWLKNYFHRWKWVTMQELYYSINRPWENPN